MTDTVGGGLYPMDFSVLERGSEISREECIQIVGVNPDAAKTIQDHTALLGKFKLRTLSLGRAIEKHFIQDRGEVVKVVCVRDGLRVLSAQDQHEAVDRVASKGVRCFQEAVALDVGNDISKLTDEQQAARLKRLSDNTFRLQQITKRKPPKLTGKE